MSDTPKPIILVDGSSYLYRAFHALPALTNSKGQPTGAIYGIINMLKRLIADYQPELMAVIFDAKGKTFRDEIFVEYKATRQAMPNDLTVQIEHIYRIIEALGLPIISIEGVEADDVIGTLAAEACKSNINLLVSTSDKDMAQLVNEQVKLINTMSNTLLDIEGVINKFGIPPERMIDYLSLVGDTSDNIPGVPKVGPKTAVKWLTEYGTLEKIIENAHLIGGKVGENLRGTIEKFPLIKSLVSIKMDVALPFKLHELKIRAANKSDLIELYTDLEFKTWLAELLQENSAADHKKFAAQYTIIEDEAEFKALLTKLEKQDEIALQLITTNMNYMTATLLGIAFGFDKESVYLHFKTEGALTKNNVLNQLKPILENESLPKISHNMKFTVEILAQEKINLAGQYFDPMLESYVLDSASNAHQLDSLSLKYLGRKIATIDELLGKGQKKTAIEAHDLQPLGMFAAAQADVAMQLHQLLWPKLSVEKGLRFIYEKIEMPLVRVLAHIEREGVRIDPEKLIKHGQTMQERLRELEIEAYELAGKTFNINSPKQIQEILFETLKLPVLQKTPKGQPSTADHVLQELAHDFRMPRIIIEYRSLSKLISTYTNKLVEQIDPNTARVHTYYNQSATSTGRLSSSDPNLQNIPIRSIEGKRIRQAFIAKPGYKIVSADYSQIELRIMAHISGDPNLLHAFSKNLDIHVATAAEVWGVSLEEVTPDMRRSAKAINFGLIYGMSAFGLTKQLGIDRISAQKYIDTYFERYPKVRDYMDNTREKVKKVGYVETLWGRRLYLPDIHASQIPRQRAAERAAINAPLQGSAADIIKQAMIQIHQWLLDEKINASMIMQVHDELVFEVSENAIETVSKAICQKMTDAVKLKVPLLVSVGVGDNWDSASAH